MTSVYRRDAQGAGRFVRACLDGEKAYQGVSVDTIAWVARWAFHWAALAMRHEAESR